MGYWETAFLIFEGSKGWIQVTCQVQGLGVLQKANKNSEN